MSELKPCPFCGNKPDMWYTERIGLWTIHCFNEDAHRAGAAAKTEAEAIEAWNTRHERTCELEPPSCGARRCKRCGAFVSVDAVFDCCGVIPTRFCPNCGAKVVE